MHTFVGDTQCLEDDSRFHRQPVQLLQDLCDVVVFTFPQDNPSCSVLYTLQLLDLDSWEIYKERVTTVQSGGDEGMHKLLCGITGEHMPDG